MQVGDLVSSISARGRNGKIVDIDLAKGKAQVQWATKKTWVAIDNLIKRA